MYSDTACQANAFHGIGRLLDYFHMERCELPKDAKTLEDVAAFLEDTGLIILPTTLEGDWYRTSAGPFLVQNEDGTGMAVLPDWLGRYYFYDEGTRQRVYFTGKNSRKFSAAYSVTRDFPGNAVKTSALIGRMFRELSWYEGLLLLLWGLLGGGLWILLAGQIHSALSTVILTADLSALWGSAAVVLAIALLETLLVFSGRQVVRRAAQKAALAVLLGMGKRIYSVGEVENSEAVAAGMAALRSNAERIMAWFLTDLWGLMAILVILLPLQSRSSKDFIAAALVAAVLYAVAAVSFCLRAGRKVHIQAEEERREWLLHQESDRLLGIDRPFPEEGNVRRQERFLGAAWPMAALLVLPVVYFAVENGSSAARLVQTLLLYLPAAALPLSVLLGALQAGRSMAEIRWLMPLAEKRPTGNVALPPMGSVFELKDVTFAYPGRTESVLQGVTLRLHPGETVGILGATGSGKTTMARLMTGLLQPTGGTIYYGGVELTRYNGGALRRRIACDQGTDILLCRKVPVQRDGRTCVVFSTREDALEGCDRIFQLVNGKLGSKVR